MKPSLHIKVGEEIVPSQVIMLMIAGENQFNYALLNHLSKEIVEFGYFISEQFNDEEWSVFFGQHEIFAERYFQVAIAFNVMDSLLIPEGFYSSDDASLQLNTVYGNDIESNLVTELLAEQNLYNIYRLPVSLHSVISRQFSNAKFWNLNTVFLKSFYEKEQSGMLIDFRKNEFSLLVMEKSKLQLARVFEYSSPEDVMYYLLKVCHQLDLKQESIKIVLSGLIEKDSAIYRELYKYFIHLEFDSLAAGIKTAGELCQYPDHYFSSVTKLAQCVL